MKIKFGMIVTEGRNKIGGHVLSRNRAGAFARTKVTPTNPQTSFQVNVRASIASLASGWRALTAAQIAAWNAAVKDYVGTDIFGDKVTPSGFNLYMKLNQNLYTIGEAAISDPPVPTAVASFTSFTPAMANGADTATLTFAPAINAGETVEIFATPGMSPGKNYVKSDFRLIGTSTGASPLDVKALYAAKFGAVPAAGLKVFFKCVHVNETTGQAGQANQASCVVAV